VNEVITAFAGQFATVAPTADVPAFQVMFENVQANSAADPATLL
jgi:hypothetical protein